ncbi:MAG: hypothetical protein J6A75_08590 [Lachnospiraceae bacterium]|nr:hypothetical protein [Lachnospiraceae bacterium]
MKRTILAWVLAMSMTVTLLPATIFAENADMVDTVDAVSDSVKAATDEAELEAATVVSIGGTELVSGKYYRAANRGDAVSTGVLEIEEAKKGESYLYYEAGVLTVEGQVYIETETDHALTIGGGMLTITGENARGLSLDSESGSAIYNSTGTKQCLVKTEGYSGNITLEGGGSEVVSNVGLDLSTTGTIFMKATGETGGIVRSTVSGDNVHLSADLIFVIMDSTTDYMFTNSGTVSMIQTREDWSFSIEGKTSGLLFGNQKSIYLEANGDITIENLAGGAGKDLTAESAKGSIYLALNSSNAAITGDINLTAKENIVISNDAGSVTSASGSLTVLAETGSISVTGINTSGAVVDVTSNLTAKKDINITNEVGTESINTQKENTFTTDGFVVLENGEGISVSKDGVNTLDIGIFGGEITDGESLDFRTGAPTEKTYYTIGSGFLVYTPATEENNSAKILLHEVNAYPYTLVLPNTKVTVNLDGYNVLQTPWENVTDMTICSSEEAKLEVNCDFILSEDAAVQIESGNLEITKMGTLEILSVSSLAVKEGARITNNSFVYVPSGTSKDAMAALGLTGTGFVGVKNAEGTAVEKYCDNTGTDLGTVVIDKVSLTDTEVTAEENLGYTWLKSGSKEKPLWTLTLDGVIFRDELYVRYTVDNMRIVTTKDSQILGDIFIYPTVEFAGEGTLTTGHIYGFDVTVSGTLKVEADENICALSCSRLKIEETGMLEVSGGYGIHLGGLCAQGFSFARGGKVVIDAAEQAFFITDDLSGVTIEEMWDVPESCMPEGYTFAYMEVEEEEGMIPLYYYEYVLTQKDEEGKSIVAKKLVLEDNHSHTTVIDEAVEATCTQEGKTMGSHCGICGAVLKAQETIEKKAHTPVVDAAVEPTYTQEGKTEGSHCLICGEILKAQEIIGVKVQSEEPKITEIKDITLAEESYTYNGKVKTPAVVVKDNAGKVLQENTDYILSYSADRKNVGVYSVTVNLQGNYSGSKTLSFTIVPKGTSISKVTAAKKGFAVKWKKQKKQTTGYEISYSTNRKFTGKNAKIKTVKKNDKNKIAIKNLKAKKKYYVRIRTYKTVKTESGNVKLYSDWSKAKKVVTKR